MDTATAINLAVDVGIPVGKMILDFIDDKDIKLTPEQIDQADALRASLLEELEELIEDMED